MIKSLIWRGVCAQNRTHFCARRASVLAVPVRMRLAPFMREAFGFCDLIRRHLLRDEVARTHRKRAPVVTKSCAPSSPESAARLYQASILSGSAVT